MSDRNDLKDARCKGFKIESPILFSQEEDKKGEFVIEAYTGEVVDRYWGKLAVSVDGIKSKKNMPILRDHNGSQIVGYSKKAWKDGSFFVSGLFSGVTEAAKECRALAEEGFPWQASIGIRALKVITIDEKTEMEVNGKKLKGPADIWLESQVQEVSFVPLGADSKTSVSVFSNFEEQAPAANGLDGADHKQGEIMAITMEVLAKDAPELLSQIQQAAKAEGLAAGVEQERNRIKSVSEQFMPGHEALIQGLMYDGKTTGPEAAVKVLSAEKLVRTSAQQNLQADTVPPVKTIVPVDTPLKKDSKEAFEADKDLVDEFENFENYSIYLAAVKEGRIRTLKTKGDNK